jgi:hypothetical protein
LISGHRLSTWHRVFRLIDRRNRART